MTTLREAVRSLIATDATITTLATGGVWDQERVLSEHGSRNGLTLKVIQDNSDPLNPTPIVLPSVYLHWSAASPRYRPKMRAKTEMLHTYFYDHESTDKLVEMAERMYDLLHEQRVAFDTPSGWYMREMRYAGGALSFNDPQLANTPAMRTRYEVILVQT